MDAEKINVLLMVFTGVLAVAILMQSIIFIGMYRYIRRMTAWMESVSEELRKNIDTASARAGEALATVKAIGEDLKPISEKLNSTTEIVHNRIVALDAFLDDTTNRAQLEILRIQDAIELASQRVGDTMNILQKSILAPVNEINAIARGISVGIDMFLRRKRNLSAVSHQDEEMFI